MDDDLESLMDTASDEDSERERTGLTAQRQHTNRLPLHQFLRLIAGGRMVDHGSATTNDDLVAALKRGGVIQSEAVARAMRACPRDLFVPEEYRTEALADSPIRLESMEFNVSAPHMHATCLEALEIQPGHKVLDVGCGCGLLTACAAFLAGKGGTAVGIDTKRQAVRLCRDNLRRLVESGSEYKSTACDVEFRTRDVFLPCTALRGRFDRVHVGASCPPEHLGPLLAMLRPEGGRIVVPVAPSDLRVIVKAPDGSISQRVLSQVRFSELEVPGDACLLMAILRADRKARTTQTVLPSTYLEDLAGVRCRAAVEATKEVPERSPCSPQAVMDLPQSPPEFKTWLPRQWSAFLGSCGGSSRGSSFTGDDPVLQQQKSLHPATVLRELGAPDVVLVSPDFHLPVHSEILKQRCEHFRARCDSGMLDADLKTVPVPDHFELCGVQAFVQYMYHDEADFDVGPDVALATLPVAQYYGVPRLVQECEHSLACVLLKKRPGSAAGDEAAAAAPSLLALADECGLGHLRAVALDFMVSNYEEVAAQPAFSELPTHLVVMVAREACALHSRMLCALRSLGRDELVLPEPVYQ